MYIVTYPSSSEFGSGKPEVEFLKTVDDLNKFILNHRGDLARVRIFKATEFSLDMCLVEKKNG